MAIDEHAARMENDPNYRKSFLRKQEAERKILLDQLQDVGRVFDDTKLSGMNQRPAGERRLSSANFELRGTPHTDSDSWSRQIDRRRRRRALVTHWGVGEVVRGNNIWFYCNVGGWTGWIWSGSFEPEDRGMSGLPKKSPPEKPKRLTMEELEVVRERNFLSLAMESSFGSSISRPSRKDSRKLQHSPEEERQIQSRMAYRIGPDRWFGWVVTVDTAKGKTREYWRLTRDAAERVGHRKLERNVLRRRRMYDAANPKTVTAIDRWIVEPTQAEQTAKEIADWDAQFNEEGS